MWWLNLVILCHLTWIGSSSGEGELRFSIREEMQEGTFVGNVVDSAGLSSQHSAEVLQAFRYGILPPSGETEVELFTMDELTGVIVTRTRVDREELCPHKAECSVYFDVTVSGPDNILTLGVLVDIIDINDNAPVFPERRTKVEIPESATPGQTYNLPLASDLDSPLLGIQRYELVTDIHVFELNVITVGNTPRSLQLVLKEQLDRERREFYQVTLMAYDGDSLPKTGSLLIDIVIGDSNDHGPEFLNSSYEVTVLEDVEVTATVLTVRALDQDTGANGQVTYTLAPGPDSVTSEKFGVVDSSGEIYVKEPLDYEKQKVYELVVEARDGGANSQPAYTTVTIHIKDVNDNAPQITVNILGDEKMAQISETAEVGSFVAHFLVRDQDSGSNGNFTCHLDEPHFHLRQQQRSQFRLVTAAGLNRESQDQFELTVMCQDYGLPSLTSTVGISVIVLDANDNVPVFSKQSYSVNILENNQMGAYVLQVNATDADLGVNAKITYKLGPEVTEFFTIDGETGVIRANTVFDYEKIQDKPFLVLAVDGGNPPLSSSALVAVTILDTNDEAPHFSQDHYSFEVQENQPKGLQIGVVSAVDPDSEPFSHFEFSIQSGGSSKLFDIDPKSGHLSTRATLDREEQSLYFITVVASNTGDTIPLSSTATVAIQVLDSNDNAPIITFPSRDNHTVMVSNMVPVGYRITQVEAFDLDQGNNAALSYRLDDHGQDTGFYIDSSSGMVATGVGLQSMDASVFEVEIIVSDLGFPPKSSRHFLNISVNKSVVYEGRHGNLLHGNNLTIVVALALSCSAVVLILIIAIVVLRLREKRKRDPKHIYQCRIEEQRLSDRMENEKQQKNNLRNQTTPNKSNKNTKKEVNFNIDPTAKTESGNIQNVHNGGVEEKAQNWPANITTVNNQSDHQGAVPAKPPRISVGPPQRHSSASIPINTQNKLWELSIKDLQAQQKGKPSNTHEDHDSDSAYSGDVSNTDSGRGPSEEGENLLQGVPCGSCPGQGRQTSGRWAPKSYIPNVHQMAPGTRAPGKQTYHGHPPTNNMPASRSHLGVPKPKQGQGHHTQVPSGDYHGYHVPTQSLYNGSYQRPGSPTEDFADNASSTSGSYVVDSRDLHQGDFDGSSYKSVVV